MLKFGAFDGIFKVLHIANFGQLNCEFIKMVEFNNFKFNTTNFHGNLIRSEFTYKIY